MMIVLYCSILLGDLQFIQPIVVILDHRKWDQNGVPIKILLKIPTEIWQMWARYTHSTLASTLYFKSNTALTKQRQLSLIIISQISFGFSFWQVTVYVHLMANPVGCCQQLGRTSRNLTFIQHWFNQWLSTGLSKALLSPVVKSKVR